MGCPHLTGVPVAGENDSGQSGGGLREAVAQGNIEKHGESP